MVHVRKIWKDDILWSISTLVSNLLPVNGRGTAVWACEHCNFVGSKSRIFSAIRFSGSGRIITSWQTQSIARYRDKQTRLHTWRTSSWKSEQPNFQEIHPSREKRTAQWRTTACKILEHRIQFDNWKILSWPTSKILVHSILNFRSPASPSFGRKHCKWQAAPCEVAFPTNHYHFAAGCQVNWQTCLAHSSRSGSQTGVLFWRKMYISSIFRGFILLWYAFRSPCCPYQACSPSCRLVAKEFWKSSWSIPLANVRRKVLWSTSWIARLFRWPQMARQKAKGNWK